MSDPTTNDATLRLDRALTAFLRQEFGAPIVTMQGFLEIIADDARRFGLERAMPDLERICEAADKLADLVARVIDAPEKIRNAGETVDEFQMRMHHDLRTPLNAIKGYSELLIEDLQESGETALLSDLNRVRESVEALSVKIDAMIDRARADSHETSPVKTVIDFLQTVAPVADVAHSWKFESRILVVDDIAANRDLLSRRLEREGHQVVSVSSGMEALDKLVQSDFDLILLDLMMPEMSGFEVLCRLKSSSKTRHIPVVMISALNELDSTVRCIEAGAEDFIAKPFNPILLRARIAASLEKKWLRDREQKYFDDLRIEKQRSESLLLNILPQSVITRMRGGETAIADHFVETTILFSDLVGFTALATGLSPGELIEILSRVFLRFDEAVAKRGLEKIKTIGDAYMVAGGLPEPASDHCHQLAGLALEMITIMGELRRELGIELDVRIGLSSGPAVAGVIGSHKFIYDVWGDTVNTASRMETFGAAGRIHVSGNTQKILQDDFRFEPRGKIEIKGKGFMDTYFLLGPI